MIDVPFDSDREAVRLSETQRRRKLALILVGFSAALILPFVRTIGGETTLHEIVELAGMALIVLAILGRSWCTLYIGGRKKREIVATGPYSISRNPLYVFSLIGIFGIGAQTGSVLLGPLLMAVGLAIFLPVILAEERLLAGRFGSEYAKYRMRVPRFGPKLSLWQDMETVPARPRLVARTAAEGMLLLLAIPICESVEWLQDAGYFAALLFVP